MTLSVSSRRNDYTGNGNVDTYAYGFKIFNEDELQVLVRDPSTDEVSELVLNTDYTVTGVGVSSGGNVVLTNSGQAWLDAGGDLEVSWVLTILGATPYTQDTSIRNQGAYYASTHEDTFDKFIMIMQQISEQLARTIRIGKTIPASDLDGELPYPLTAGGLLAVNTTGDGVEVIPSATTAVVTTQIRNGTTALASSATSKAIAFSSDMPSTSYSISVMLKNTTDALPLLQPAVVTAKSISGFTVSWSEPLDTANYELEWLAVEY